MHNFITGARHQLDLFIESEYYEEIILEAYKSDMPVHIYLSCKAHCFAEDIITSGGAIFIQIKIPKIDPADVDKEEFSVLCYDNITKLLMESFENLADTLIYA